MEFDNLITYILLFLFFVLPSVLKGLGKKKKPVQVKKKKGSLFGKLGEAVQQFLRELEKQAQEAQQKARAKEQGSVWEDLADEDEIELILPEDKPPAVSVKKPVPESFDPDHPFVSPKKKPVPVADPVMAESHPGSYGLPEIRGEVTVHSLQQAVVWSEILGKPVALRND